MQFKGLGVPNKYFAEQNGLCIYEDTAGAMKPLNVLSKFENHFANQTVRFSSST
jgi:hypothetical protein